MWLVSLPLLYWMKPPSISLYRQVVLVTLLLTLVGQLFNSFVLTKVISSDKNHAQRDATNQRVFRNITKRHCFLTISWRHHHVIKTTPVQLFRVHEVLYRNDANTRTLAVTPVAFFPSRIYIGDICPVLYTMNGSHVTVFPFGRDAKRETDIDLENAKKITSLHFIAAQPLNERFMWLQTFMWSG